LYYRLKKAQRISGINLRDGRDRLAIHLAFKIARSSGRYPA
jgi:DNA-binding PucR family transcriptional regulator